MAFFQSPTYAYQQNIQPGHRDFAQAFCPQYQHNGFEGNPFEGQQQHHEHYWNQGCYEDFSTTPPTEMPAYNSQLQMSNQYQQDGYHLHHYQPQNSNIIGQPTVEGSEEDKNIELTLENKDLWDKFSRNVTEMIITRAGR